LIHPTNLNGGIVKWPIFSKKPMHIVVTKATKGLLVMNGNYVLIKRFTAKEEKKRIVASILEGSRFHYNSR
jgi:adenine-specific DNA-methyltransferase